MKKFLVAISVFAALASSASAATLSVSAPQNTLPPGKPFEVFVHINSDLERINAVQGEVVVPGNVSVKEIRDGNSIINFWVDRPKYLPDAGKISFSGIIPGGYNGDSGLLFSVVLEGTSGSGSVSVRNAKVLLNDGRGTPAGLKTSDFSFGFSSSAPAGGLVSPLNDGIRPEEFVPTVSNDPAVFDGQWFLVFATQDKGSGIDHYEIKEGGSPFVAGSSPYLLKNQALDESIQVKAVDRTGNYTIALLPAPHPQPWYEQKTVWIIIIVILYFVLYSAFLKRDGEISKNKSGKRR